MKKHVVATVGTVALLANLLLPGLAFGQPYTDNQESNVTLGCGQLSLIFDANNDFTLLKADGGAFSVETTAQDAFGKTINSVTYQDGSNAMPNEAFVAVSDTRTVGGGAGCATNATNEGWLLQIDAESFSETGGNSITNANFYVVTSTSVSPDAGFSERGTDGTDDNAFYTTAYAGPYNAVAAWNVADTDSLTAAATFTAFATDATLNNTNDILANATGVGTNDYMFTSVGTGLAYYLNIPANQGGGAYTSTVTMDLVTST